MTKQKKQIAVIDFETDPFLYGRVPAPFAAGLRLPGEYREFWGADCVDALVRYLDDMKTPLVIYAHNGGKFDYFFMLQYLENPIKVIGTRIAKAKMGIHELRDSYSIIPVPLGAYKKTPIDYRLMEADKRDANRAEISQYLKDDCDYLYELVAKFRERFGDKLTIGATAINELKKLHPFDAQNASHDEFFRPWFFGGRVEYFESGVLSGDWKVYDVNSMYPHVMKNYSHPTGAKYRQQYGGELTRSGNIKGMADYPVYFATIECDNHGAFPTRIKGESLRFDVLHGEFNVTSHELKAALDTGRVSRVKIKRALFPESVISFGDYVDTHAAEKIRAKKAGDKVAELFAKLLLNSAYGKFAQNPDHFYSYFIQEPGDEIPDGDYEIYMIHDSGVNLWRKPSDSMVYFDVATAASITGASRAVLMRGLSAGKRVVYCDTDSIICEALPLELSETALGAWKLEGRGNTLAIAGKKLYALRDGGKCVKSAHKGALLSDDEIFRIARGGVVSWKNDAPTFSLSKGVSFIDRKIQSAETKKAEKKRR
jgi:hypothetical protein